MDGSPVGHVGMNDINSTGGLTGPHADSGVDTQSATTGITVDNAGGGQAHNNMQPSITVNRMIRT